MSVTNPRDVPEYELNPMEIHFRKTDYGNVKVKTGFPQWLNNFWKIQHNLLSLIWQHAQGNYQVAKWNGTKVAVKIFDKESFSDPESM